MAAEKNDYGWHLVDSQWILGRRLPGERAVSNPEAVIEKRAGTWYWCLSEEEDWRTSGSLNEAMASASEVLWKKHQSQR